jgi:hypothetical protein
MGWVVGVGAALVVAFASAMSIAEVRARRGPRPTKAPQLRGDQKLLGALLAKGFTVEEARDAIAETREVVVLPLLIGRTGALHTATAPTIGVSVSALSISSAEQRVRRRAAGQLGTAPGNVLFERIESSN